MPPIVPERRVVLLGASNLTMGLSTVVETAQNIWRQPLEIFGALGHGRSYGQTSSVLARQLPGIAHCGLWEALAARPGLPTAALVTDIGNDLLYEVEVRQIVDWVALAIDRLQQRGARVCLTLLPIAGISQLKPGRFRFFRRLFFPRCRLELAEVVERATLLYGQLKQVGVARQVAVVEQRSGWYGLDPIHIRRPHWRHAWSEILASWNDSGSPIEVAHGSLARWIYLQSRRPLEQTMFAQQQRTMQPSATLKDGTTIAFY